VALNAGFDGCEINIEEDHFPDHLVFTSTGVDPQLSITFLKASDKSISVSFSVDSSVDGLGKVYFKTAGSDFNDDDMVAFQLQKGIHNYYLTIPVVGVEALRLDVAESTGTFSLDGFSVFYRDDNGISTRAAQLASTTVNIDTFSNDDIRGTVDLDHSGLVYFSIPFDPGWKVYVDDKLSEKIRANVAFTGVYIGPGTHSIELKYSIPWMREGMAISGLTFVAMVIFVFARSRVKATRNPE
jgi:uncharacterized membrane protein YfhO